MLLASLALVAVATAVGMVLRTATELARARAALHDARVRELRFRAWAGERDHLRRSRQAIAGTVYRALGKVRPMGEGGSGPPGPPTPPEPPDD